MSKPDPINEPVARVALHALFGSWQGAMAWARFAAVLAVAAAALAMGAQ